MTRELAVAETSIHVSGQSMQQLFLATKDELERMRQEYPTLIVRWATQEDRKQWALSRKLFDDPKGVATRDMVVLPDEVRDRIRAAKRQRRL